MPDRSTLDAFRESRLLAFTTGTILLVAGVVLLFWPDRTVTVVARFVGVLLVIAGIAECLEAFTTRGRGSGWGLLLLRGLLNLATGVLLVFWPGITLGLLVWLAGINFVVTGVIGLIASRSLPAEIDRSTLTGRSVIGILFGIVLVAWPSATVSVVAFVAGIGLALLGLVLLYSGYQLGRLSRT